MCLVQRVTGVIECFVVSGQFFIGIFLLFLLTTAPEIIEIQQKSRFLDAFTRTRFAILFTYGACMLFFAAVITFYMHTIMGLLFAKRICCIIIFIIITRSIENR
jgi:hypothetical protein